MSFLSSALAPVQVGHVYLVTTRVKTADVEKLVQVNWIENHEDCWYIGYTPAGKSVGACGFGATRVSKPGHETAFGVVSCEYVREAPKAPPPFLPNLVGNPSYDLMM